MIFSSIQYLLFLPVVVFLYWRTRGSVRLLLVVLASYFFYMSWLPVYGLFLLALTTINYLIGTALARVSGAEADAIVAASAAGEATSESLLKKRKLLLALGLFVNLGCLCYYKYTNFLIENLAHSFTWLAGLLGSHAAPWDVPVLKVVLPLGISFFVFEFVHYLVDIYRGNKPIRSFMEFAAFASFFPSQIAGPIKRYQDFQEKLEVPEPWTSGLFSEGCALIAQGLFKKVAIADPIGAVVNGSFQSLVPMSCADVIVAAIGFTIQVYCDFSGYTDIGRGSALLLGIRLPENFNLPYLATDLAELWRRWHMSLSFWLRDYVYIPLGGSRTGMFGNSRNLLITMIVCGLWHGASWHYIVFGAIHGSGLIVNREYKNLLKKFKSYGALVNTAPGKMLAVLVNMMFIVATYAIFRAPDMVHVGNLAVSLGNVDMPCTLWEGIQKSGVIYLLAVYFAFWQVTELCARRPDLFRWVRDAETEADQRLRFSAPLRWASWTAA
ncbi:MAG TPA: MBOAT family O-acyltransferase, partial [Chroococcales cyanobacterium]